ncbi:DUF4163 domain-containing protein [Flavobacterium sp. NST-5]|uniref:DUF4163 domain-containing protein n=1 Tax=Flavobacterium ichthyis TaxID=2698827 RepID=A0ABW9ZC91_9FLAO|nr:DUF3298 and DUF4163 domain-containing protein [Flavobacterium ichthyis]NBL65404.1 DUF4163 domain-containing protein [Flavobacterium ichthyis]
MKNLCLISLIALSFVGCKKDPKENPETAGTLSFKTENFEKKTTLPCDQDVCATVKISVPTAENVPVAADSINNKIFNTVRSIVYFGEKPTNSKTYQEIMDKFIASYENLKQKYPDERAGWEAKIDAKITYETENVINVSVENYMFTGGAHGYQGIRSLLFDAKTGKELKLKDYIKDEASLLAMAEKLFREKYKIGANDPINKTGLMFEGEKFALPQNIFFTKDGLLLYYNTYEVAAYVEGAKEVLIPYNQLEGNLLLK